MKDVPTKSNNEESVSGDMGQLVKPAVMKDAPATPEKEESALGMG